jgi:hypothetical protein
MTTLRSVAGSSGEMKLMIYPCPVVVDENWLALSDNRWKPDIAAFGNIPYLDTLRTNGRCRGDDCASTNCCDNREEYCLSEY